MTADEMLKELGYEKIQRQLSYLKIVGEVFKMISFSARTSWKSFLINWDNKTYKDNCYLSGANIDVATNKDLENLKKIF